MSTSPVSASNSPVVLIAASESVPGLNVQDYFDRETLVFPDSECLRALEAIMEHRPSLVVLEQIFAATPRGAAIINQIRSDPALSSSEICLFAPDGDKGRVERAAAVRWVPRGRATAASRLPWYARHRAFHDALRSEGAARRGVGRAARFLQNRRADRLPENSAPGPAGAPRHGLGAEMSPDPCACGLGVFRAGAWNGPPEVPGRPAVQQRRPKDRCSVLECAG